MLLISKLGFSNRGRYLLSIFLASSLKFPRPSILFNRASFNDWTFSSGDLPPRASSMDATTLGEIFAERSASLNRA